MSNNTFIIFGPFLWILDISSWQDIWFLTRNPIVRSKINKSNVQGPKVRKDQLRLLFDSSYPLIRYSFQYIVRVMTKNKKVHDSKSNEGKQSLAIGRQSDRLGKIPITNPM